MNFDHNSITPQIAENTLPRLKPSFSKLWKCPPPSPSTLKTDKSKDIDGYVSKLTDVINDKIGSVNGMCEIIDHVMSEIKNETNMFDEKIHKVSEMDNDTLHLISDKLKEIINQLRKNLTKIVI